MKKLLFICGLLSINLCMAQGRAPAVDPDVIINPRAERAGDAVPPHTWNFQNPMPSRNSPPAGVVIGREARMQWAQEHTPNVTSFNLGYVGLMALIMALPIALVFMIRTWMTPKDGPTWSEKLTAEVFELEGERMAREKADKSAQNKKDKPLKKAS